MSAGKIIEESTEFTPKFDANGLIPAIAQDVKTGQILMVAYMNAEALELSKTCGRALADGSGKVLYTEWTAVLD